MTHTYVAKIKIDQNCKIHLQILDILCKNVGQNCRDLKKKFTRCPFFNPIPPEGGHIVPGRSEMVCHFHRVGARFTKIHDFVPFNV